MLLAWLRRWQGEHLGALCVVSKQSEKNTIVCPFSNPIHQLGEGAYKEVISVAKFQNISWCWTLRWRVHARNPDTINAVSCTNTTIWHCLIGLTQRYSEGLCSTIKGPRRASEISVKHRDYFWNKYLLHFFVESSIASVKYTPPSVWCVSPHSHRHRVYAWQSFHIFITARYRSVKFCTLSRVLDHIPDLTEVKCVYDWVFLLGPILKDGQKDIITIKSNGNRQTYPIAARICSAKSNSGSRCGVHFPRIIDRQSCTVSCAGME